MSSLAKRITRVTLHREGDVGAEVIYENKNAKRNKDTFWLVPARRGNDRLNKALKVFATELHERTRRSNRKKRDGWLLDAPLNVVRAQSKALQELIN